MPNSSAYRPIIYLRGYAATEGEIDATVSTPYMGFNLGSTKLRQAYGGSMVPFVFESPLVRLMKDEGYTDCFDGGAFRRPDALLEGEEPRALRPTVPAKSVWIYRYYEDGEEVSGVGKRRTIEEWAAGLYAFIKRVRDCVCGDDAEARADFKVHLVAHSMGGLVVRSYLQAFCRNRLEQFPGERNPMVDKVFTYGTPHGGIEVRGINAPDLGWLDKLDVGNFNHERMREFLGLDRDEPVNSLDEGHPVERFFCFVGTNHRDYAAFFGVSKRAVGALSDGLVLMKNAYVRGAPRAYAHRSHSGPYGLVNSEEGYQNLRRFLFGDVRVDVKLCADRITLPPELATLKREAEEAGKQLEIRGKYHISTVARVRNANYQLHERRTVFGSQQLADYDEMIKQNSPVYLFSGFLSKAGLPQVRGNGLGTTAEDERPAGPLGFQVEVEMEVPLFELNKRFWFDKHFAGEELFRETATFEVDTREDPPAVTCQLKSWTRSAVEAEEDAPADVPFEEVEWPGGPAGGRRFAVQVGHIFRRRASLSGKLLLEVQPWA